MSDENQDQPETTVDSEEIESAPVEHTWRTLWQAPALLAGAGLLMLGLAYTITGSPDPSVRPSLEVADRLIDSEQYEQAIEVLNTKVYPWVAQEDAVSDADKIRYHIDKARAIERGQRSLGFELDENHVSVVREYLEAERLGALLEPVDLAALSRTYLALGDLKSARIRADQIPSDRREMKTTLRKRIVEDLMDRQVPLTSEATEILSGLLADQELDPSDRVWALERTARIRLDEGFVDETITRILREMPRLERVGVEGRSRLHLLLARAYLRTGALPQAREQIDSAYALSGAGDPHYPEILLAHGQLEDIEGNIQRARDVYAEIVDNYSRDRAFPLALLGLGETEAALGDHELSLQAYENLIDNYDAIGIESEPSRTRVMDSAVERASDSMALGNPEDAVRYTMLAERLFKNTQIPAPILDMHVRSHVGVAEKLLGKPVSETSTLLGLDPSTRSEVQRHLMTAATNARLHADRYVVSNIDRFAESLWTAADLFDRAGDHREAITAFQTYADSIPSDPRYAEALFRLAECLRSVGEYARAATIYTRLIDEREGFLGADIGPFADASMVPLAQAYLYDEDATNDAKAEQLLLRALDGTRVSPETDLYRHALLELAGHYDRTDRAERAIERYDEFVARYQGDPETATVVFRLADAHRRLADEIEASLSEPMPAAQRDARAAKARTHRTEAIGVYEDAIKALSDLNVSQTGIFETVALRNAYFYLGDCAFDLERYDDAIRYYDIARDRYSDEPASLIAMVQIVNAYIAKGELERAKTANQRAQRFYATIPDDVWEDPDLPMDREDWERWLASSSILLTQASGS